MEYSKVEWPDHTFNPWIGCSHNSPGCLNCYAEAMMDKRYHRVKWGKKGTRSRTSEVYWRQPHKWNRRAAERGVVETVFCASLADVFEDRDDLIDWRLDLFDDVIDKTPNLIWLLLTKRVDVAAQFLKFRRVPSNVWLGHSICTQQESDVVIPKLAKLWKKVGGLFLSCEPLLESVDLGIASQATAVVTGRRYYQPSGGVSFWKERWNEKLEVIPSPVNWIIAGGESGPDARPCDVAWLRSIRDQCKAADVPVFIKQLGSNPVGVPKLRSAKGGDIQEWPQDLRVREFPEFG